MKLEIGRRDINLPLTSIVLNNNNDNKNIYSDCELIV